LFYSKIKLPQEKEIPLQGWGRENAVEEMMDGEWFKSSYSNAEGNCLEVDRRGLRGGSRVKVRDSKDTGMAPLEVSRQAWAFFVPSLRAAQV
jgi:hypothetical protein